MVTEGATARRECRAPGRRVIWLVRAAQADEFPTLDAFIAAMEAAPLHADAEGRRYSFRDPVYGPLRCGWQGPLVHDGAPMRYQGYDRYGRLTLQAKEG